MKVEADKIIVSFFELVEENPIVRTRHLGLYIALLSECIRYGGANPFTFSRARIMKMAKISSRSTFNQTMSDLVKFGFIRYMPCRNSLSSNLVFFKKLDG